MGLDINGFSSEKDYHWGYSGIHQVRVLALKALGIDKELNPDVIERTRRKIEGIRSGDAEKPSDEYVLSWCLKEWLYGEGIDNENAYLDNDDTSKIDPYYQLIKFTDCDGILIPRGYLEGIDYSKSILLGCSDDLREELNNLANWILRNPERVNSQELEIFNMLHDLVEDECEGGGGILVFH